MLSDVGFRESGGCSNEDGHGGDAKRPTASGPDNSEGVTGETTTVTVPGTSGVGTQRGGSRDRWDRLRLLPHVQCEGTRILHAYNSKRLHWRLREQECSVAKLAYVRYTGAQEKVAFGLPLPTEPDWGPFPCDKPPTR